MQPKAHFISLQTLSSDPPNKGRRISSGPPASVSNGPNFIPSSSLSLQDLVPNAHIVCLGARRPKPRINELPLTKNKDLVRPSDASASRSLLSTIKPSHAHEKKFKKRHKAPPLVTINCCSLRLGEEAVAQEAFFRAALTCPTKHLASPPCLCPEDSKPASLRVYISLAAFPIECLYLYFRCLFPRKKGKTKSLPLFFGD